MSTGGQMLLGPSGNLWFAQAPDHIELDALRMTFIISLHSGPKGVLSLAPRPRLLPLRSPPR